MLMLYDVCLMFVWCLSDICLMFVWCLAEVWTLIFFLFYLDKYKGDRLGMDNLIKDMYSPDITNITQGTVDKKYVQYM